MAGAVRDEVSAWWLKADETPGGALVRCVELVHTAMQRHRLSLPAAVDHVCDALVSAGPALSVYGLREGYAERLDPPRLASPAVGWGPGRPVPDGYREETVYGRHPSQGRAVPAGWGPADSVQLARPVRRIKWAGDGPEHERRQTMAEWVEGVRKRWKALAHSGNLDAASGRWQPQDSRLAIQREAAAVLGLGEAPTPEDVFIDRGTAARPGTCYARGVDGQAVPVRRLVELLAMLEPVRAAPLAEVRAAMRRRLFNDGAPLYLAAARVDGYVQMLPSEEVWCPSRKSGREKWHAVNPAQRLESFLDFDDAFGRRAMRAEEAVWRGVPLQPARGEQPRLDGELVRLRQPEWEALPALPELRGAAGALEAFCLFLADGVERAAPDMVRRVRELAITEADARRLFPEAYASLVAPVEPMGRQVAASRSGDAVAEVLLPAGGAWPHSPTAKWTHAERDAMFEMRHRLGMTNKAIAAVVGAESDQTITHQIGSRDAWKNRDWAGGPQGWKPSPGLLARCGLVDHAAVTHRAA